MNKQQTFNIPVSSMREYIFYHKVTNEKERYFEITEIFEIDAYTTDIIVNLLGARIEQSIDSFQWIIRNGFRQKNEYGYIDYRGIPITRPAYKYARSIYL
jgi:hypothetical protein